MTKRLTIGQFADLTKVKVTTIRYYERCGLLMPDSHSESGYRYYYKNSIAKLRFIKNAQHLGFTIEEIIELLQLQSNTDADCAVIKKQATDKLYSIEKKIKSLQKMQQALQNIHNQCRGKGPLTGCPIIEALNHTDFEDK